MVLGLVLAGIAAWFTMTWADEAATRERLWLKLSSGHSYGQTFSGYASLKDCLEHSKTLNTVPFCMEIDQAVEKAVRR